MDLTTDDQVILVIDDDDLTLKTLGLLLEDLATVETAMSGREALEKLGSMTPDLIILDVDMPQMDGYEFCDQLKADEQWREIPVAFLTARTTNKDEERGLDAGAIDFIRKPVSPKILTARTSNILELQAAKRNLLRLATTDSLTGAFNRRHFYEAGHAEYKRSQRYGHVLTLLMLDVDHFKSVNDIHGHAVGDDALKATVTAIHNVLRTEDVLGRLGGEEFAVMLPETPLEGAMDVGERIRKAISEIVVETPTSPLSFTISIGASQVIPDDKDIDGALSRADKALYAAKEGGRNRVAAA